MQPECVFRLSLWVAASIASGVAGAEPARAAVIAWTDWTSATIGATTGSASGRISGSPVTVTYTGEVLSQTRIGGDYPSYNPGATFTGGTVGDAPFPHDIIAQNGGPTKGVNRITFSSPVKDPVMAIWSLGQYNLKAEYDFSAPFKIESSGPSAEYGGASLTSAGNKLFGKESNGAIQFIGVYSSITFTNPVYENWFGFTLGAPATALPEPASAALFGLSLPALALARRNHRPGRS